MRKSKQFYKLFIQPVIAKRRFKIGGKHSTKYEILYVGNFTDGIAKAVCRFRSHWVCEYRIINIDKKYNFISETNIHRSCSSFYFPFIFDDYARFYDEENKMDILLDRDLEIPSKFVPLLREHPSNIELEVDYIVVQTSSTKIIMNYNLDIVARLSKDSHYSYLGSHFISVDENGMQGFDIYNLKTCEKVHREYLKIGQFYNGIAQFQGLDGKWGFINDELSVIIPSTFPRIYEFTKKGVWVESIDGKKTHLNF